MSQMHPRPGVSVAVFRGDEVLLIQRGKSPYHGFWSLPGGEIHWGEMAVEAARRELQEETGLLASNLTLSNVVDAILRDSEGLVTAHFTIVVYAASEVAGTLMAGDDAMDAGFFGSEKRAHLKCTPGLQMVIERAKLALDKSER